MVWTGRATRSIRKSLEPHLTLAQLQRAWASLNLENHADRLARPGLELHVVLASRDTVVLPTCQTPARAAAECRSQSGVLRLNCGHYSSWTATLHLGSRMSLKRFCCASARPPGLGALERRVERHPTAMRGAPFGPSPSNPLPPSRRTRPASGRLTEACCRFRLGASTRAQPPLQHHGDGDPTCGRYTICQLKAKTTAGLRRPRFQAAP